MVGGIELHAGHRVEEREEAFFEPSPGRGDVRVGTSLGSSARSRWGPHPIGPHLLPKLAGTLGSSQLPPLTPAAQPPLNLLRFPLPSSPPPSSSRLPLFPDQMAQFEMKSCMQSCLLPVWCTNYIKLHQSDMAENRTRMSPPPQIKGLPWLP